MTELITGIVHQPDFPKVDLTDDNAALLELMMASREMITNGHAIAESLLWSFRVGHASILQSSERAYDEVDWQLAIDHGVTTFEAIAAMVGGGHIQSNSFPINSEGVRITQLDVDGFRDHGMSALDKFHQQAPRTAEVISMSSRRYHGPLTTYAVLGAAMSWQFERDTVA